MLERYKSLSIGDTRQHEGHEQMWDSGQWVHSPDCLCKESLLEAEPTLPICGGHSDYSPCHCYENAGRAEGAEG